MRKFIWNGANKKGIVTLTGSEARHMREVLRMTVGQETVLCDGAGNDFNSVVEQVGTDFVKLKLRDKLSKNLDPKLNVILYLAHTKGERLDFAVQKAVELGARSIRLFKSERCVTDTGANKMARLNRIAFEAAKQCGGSRLTTVEDAGSYRDVLLEESGALTKLFCYELESTPIREKLSNITESVDVICGPEGGFTPREAELAVEHGWASVSLGRRILRAETAPLVALTILLYESLDI